MTGETAVAREPHAGIATGAPDLWCTYAAIRTLKWLDSVDQVPEPAGTFAYLTSRRNTDGGYAWTRGMASDAWATFYSMQGIRDLGYSPQIGRTGSWLHNTFTDGAYAMMPGQAPDVWATHFSARTSVELCGIPVPSAKALYGWLGALQTADGGLSWSPAHARLGPPDVRASFYGIFTWRALCAYEPTDPPWNIGRLTKWIRSQQTPDGGFRFAEDATEPCMWATYRACAALCELNTQPSHPADAVNWILRMRGRGGSFVRWAGYHVEDVWAAFCAIGALRALGQLTAGVAGPVISRIRDLACENGGFTYREPSAAADVLTTAAAVLRAPASALWRQGALAWLDACQLPNEGGIMYMPARGAEIRSTLWALAAGALNDEASKRSLIAWLTAMQNPDGGFGYWQGRASDIVSAAAAIESMALLGYPVAQGMNSRSLAAFVASCERSYQDGCRGVAPVPGGEPSLRSGLQAGRIRAALGTIDVQHMTQLLQRHRVRGGGYANAGARLPDLMSTYEAVATACRFGLDVDRSGVRAFLDRVSSESGTAWTPLAPSGGGDPLADCLADLIRHHLAHSQRSSAVLTLS